MIEFNYTKIAEIILIMLYVPYVQLVQTIVCGKPDSNKFVLLLLWFHGGAMSSDEVDYDRFGCGCSRLGFALTWRDLPGFVACFIMHHNGFGHSGHYAPYRSWSLRFGYDAGWLRRTGLAFGDM